MAGSPESQRGAGIEGQARPDPYPAYSRTWFRFRMRLGRSRYLRALKMSYCFLQWSPAYFAG